MNAKALRDAKSYEQTGRVRSPSPVVSTEPEDDTKTHAEEEVDGSKRNTEIDFSNPHVIELFDDKELNAQGIDNIDLSDDDLSLTTKEGDTNSDYAPSEVGGDSAEGDRDSDLESSELSDDSAEGGTDSGEEHSEVSGDTGNSSDLSTSK